MFFYYCILHVNYSNTYGEFFDLFYESRRAILCPLVLKVTIILFHKSVHNLNLLLKVIIGLASQSETELHMHEVKKGWLVNTNIKSKS